MIDSANWLRGRCSHHTRQAFWSSIHGNKSGYHVLLAQPVVLPLQVINVPADLGVTTIDSAGNRLGVVDFAWLDETVTNLNISLGIPPQALAIHLMSAIEGVDLNDGGSLDSIPPWWEVLPAVPPINRISRLPSSARVRPLQHGSRLQSERECWGTRSLNF